MPRLTSAEDQHREICQEQAARDRRTAAWRRRSRDCGCSAPIPSPAAPSRPTRRLPRCPGKREDGQQDRAPDADAGVARHEARLEGGDAHHEQGDDQRRLAADAVAVVAEDRTRRSGARRSRRRSGERLSVPTSGSSFGKYSLANTRPATGAVQEKSYHSMVVPTVRRPQRDAVRSLVGSFHHGTGLIAS